MNPIQGNEQQVLAFLKSFVALQAEMPNVITDAKGTIKSDKGSYSYKYASLAAHLETLRPLLAKHGFAVLQQAKASGEGGSVTVSIVAHLMHNQGGFASDELSYSVPAGNIKGIGSAITHLRRYALMPLLGVATEDDDGSEAEEATPSKAAKPSLVGLEELKAIKAKLQAAGLELDSGNMRGFLGFVLGRELGDPRSMQAEEAKRLLAAKNEALTKLYADYTAGAA